jgi:E3 ubiquitin-protein ligase MARCH6
MFFFVEIVIFPTICGLLINLSTVPLIPESTISTRLAYYYMKPISSIFCTWLAGTNFMFSFAQTISIVRKCIRKGVLYFIRDPSDPEVFSLLSFYHAFSSKDTDLLLYYEIIQANPLREILETPAINQAKKISRSLLVYGGIIITCFGFFPWMSRLVPMGLFPLRWNMTYVLQLVYAQYAG